MEPAVRPHDAPRVREGAAIEPRRPPADPPAKPAMEARRIDLQPIGATRFARGRTARRGEGRRRPPLRRAAARENTPHVERRIAWRGPVDRILLRQIVRRVMGQIDGPGADARTARATPKFGEIDQSAPFTARKYRKTPIGAMKRPALLRPVRRTSRRIGGVGSPADRRAHQVQRGARAGIEQVTLRQRGADRHHRRRPDSRMTRGACGGEKPSLAQHRRDRPGAGGGAARKAPGRSWRMIPTCAVRRKFVSQRM
jgi:hypothetical protein